MLARSCLWSGGPSIPADVCVCLAVTVGSACAVPCTGLNGGSGTLLVVVVLLSLSLFWYRRRSLWLLSKLRLVSISLLRVLCTTRCVVCCAEASAARCVVAGLCFGRPGCVKSACSGFPLGQRRLGDESARTVVSCSMWKWFPLRSSVFV